jgi:cytochrome c biogenesis protein CcmG/thiol:disulfide interchange protein DsbE
MEQNGKKTPRWGRIAAWALVLGLLAFIGLQLRTSSLGVVRQGELAPEFTLTTFDGEDIGPEEMQGKILVVNFWASWCKPCEQEAEDLQTAWEMYSPTGQVLFLGVDYVDTEKEALAYLERFGISYPNGPDFRTRISQAFRIQGVPETFIVDQEGRVAFVQIGPFTNLESITSVIERLLTG